MQKVIYTLLAVLTISVMNSKAYSQEWTAPKSAENIENPINNDKVSIKEAKKLFTNMCLICHGAKGKGDGVASVGLNPKPSNFSSDNVQKQSDGTLFWKMTEGRTPMASYKEILTEKQRWQLVNYIRTFNKNI